jgi:hypothetical protein
MLAALFTPAVLAAIFKEGLAAFTAYQNRQITLAQLQQQLGIIAMREARAVEEANANMVVQTYGAFTDAMKTSRLVRIVWGIVTLTQCFVLAWYQWAVPFIVWRYGGSFPPASDVLLEWAYGLLVLLVGGGAVAIRRPKQPAIPKG